MDSVETENTISKLLKFQDQWSRENPWEHFRYNQDNNKYNDQSSSSYYTQSNQWRKKIEIVIEALYVIVIIKIK